MGLIRAGLSAFNSNMADQWKEFFYCDSLSSDQLVVKGEKRTGRRSSNTRGSDNIISNGSTIAVADGQCMLIVEQGRVVEVSAESGEFIYDSSSEPSIFSGAFGEALVDSFKNIARRFSYGGSPGKDQRVYYVNTKEIIGNKFGTRTPIMFRVRDQRIGLDADVSLRCSGLYSYRISDPVRFYTNLSGNVEEEYRRDAIDETLKGEFTSALMPSFGKLSSLGLRPNEIVFHTRELEKALNESLSSEWSPRGLSVSSVAISSLSLSEEDEQMIRNAQKSAMYKDPAMAGATLVGAQADALRDAARNPSGAVGGFVGLGMASQAGGARAESFFEMSGRKKSEGWTCSCGQENSGRYCSACGSPRPDSSSWTCPECNSLNSGKFCTNCGSRKPEDEWRCSCGNVNRGNFCSSCGKKRP